MTCLFSCSIAYSADGFMATTGTAVCQTSQWIPVAPSHACRLDVGFLGAVGGGGLLLIVAVLAIVIVCVRRKRGLRGQSYTGFNKRNDPFARPPSRSGEALLENGDDPFATLPRPNDSSGDGAGGGGGGAQRSNRPAARSTGSTTNRPASRSTGSTVSDGLLTSQAIADHRGKHKHSNAAVDRWRETDAVGGAVAAAAAPPAAASSKSKPKSKVNDSSLFDDRSSSDNDEEEESKSRSSKRHHKKDKKSSKKDDKKSKSQAGSYETPSNSLGGAFPPQLRKDYLCCRWPCVWWVSMGGQAGQGQSSSDPAARQLRAV
jgi:hypothetical protein